MAGYQKATFAAGCFWCTEAIYQQLRGVIKVVSGYSGGVTKNPSYEEVITGSTGHTESIQVTYDPKIISYGQLLEVFWKTHDPTTPNQQGNDIGNQYRSIIFYHNQKQKEEAERSRVNLIKSGVYKEPIVTEIRSYENFYQAEGYHQDYYRLNPDTPYCRVVIDPKINKLKKDFKRILKI